MISWIEKKRRAARRRVLARTALGAAALAALVAAAGAILPAEHETRVHGSLDRPPEAVYRVLTDLDALPLWRSDLTRIERLPESSGRVTWRERGRSGDQVIELTESRPPHRLVTHRLVSGQAVLPERTFDLSPAGRGTLVTLTERVAISNPLRRVLVRLSAGSKEVVVLLRDLTNRVNLNRNHVASDGGPPSGNSGERSTPQRMRARSR